MPDEAVLCAHGYVLMQDSCPWCESESKTEHTAQPVKVRSPLTNLILTRCRTCGKVPSDRPHRGT